MEGKRVYESILMLQLWMQSEIVEIFSWEMPDQQRCGFFCCFVIGKRGGDTQTIQYKRQACKGCIKMSQEVRYLW